jgi:hypothetical protein
MVGDSAFRRYYIYLYSVLLGNIAEFLGFVRVKKLDIAIVGRGLLCLLFKMDEKSDSQKNDQEGEKRGYVKSDADGKSDASGRPKTCRGGKSRDLRAIADYDRSDTEKSDARNDLRANSHGVSRKSEDSDLVNTRHCRKTSADTNKYVCAQTCRASVVSALHSDASAEKQSQKHSK